MSKTVKDKTNEVFFGQIFDHFRIVVSSHLFFSESSQTVRTVCTVGMYLPKNVQENVRVFYKEHL